VLLVCSSASPHASADAERLVRDLQKLAMLAVPYDIRVAYEALSWGRHVNEYPQAWDLVQRAERHNLGLALDSFHLLATGTTLEALEELAPAKIFLVQLSDFLWQETRSAHERMETARHSRVFPGEGVHSEKVIELVRVLDEMGYRGDYSFEVFNDDYRQLPLPVVAERARRSVKWITTRVGRWSLPARRRA
jgi:sugar phosphate isomerase/epimerase